jgi:anti-sigma factor RsiW
MNCTKFMVELTDLLDEALDRDLRAELDRHMALCPHCKVVYVTTKHTIQIYRDNQLYDMEPGLRERLETAIMRKCKESSGCK